MSNLLNLRNSLQEIVDGVNKYIEKIDTIIEEEEFEGEICEDCYTSKGIDINDTCLCGKHPEYIKCTCGKKVRINSECNNCNTTIHFIECERNGCHLRMPLHHEWCSCGAIQSY